MYEQLCLVSTCSLLLKHQSSYSCLQFPWFKARHVHLSNFHYIPR